MDIIHGWSLSSADIGNEFSARPLLFPLDGSPPSLHPTLGLTPLLPAGSGPGRRRPRPLPPSRRQPAAASASLWRLRRGHPPAGRVPLHAAQAAPTDDDGAGGRGERQVQFRRPCTFFHEIMHIDIILANVEGIFFGCWGWV